jgi:GAF domain-containing protein
MTGYERLARVFVELADTLVEEFDTLDFLQGLADRCVELLDVDATGLLLADPRGDLQLMAATTERARLLELLALRSREGPCVDCYTTGLPLTNVDLTRAADRWPVFAPAAVEAGFAATHVLPLRLRRQVIGALNLFTDDVRVLTAENLGVAQAMADAATIGLLHERNLRDQTVLAEQLQAALTSRVLIEQAKGVLAERSGLSMGEAFTRLRSHARRTGLTLTAVATAVVDGVVDRLLLVPS